MICAILSSNTILYHKCRIGFCFLFPISFLGSRTTITFSSFSLFFSTIRIQLILIFHISIK
nr:MAG TPA: hypothetical protein [Bacteriophage sp.]